MSIQKRAKYGAEAFDGLEGSLPQPFPRTMGPNCLTYLREVVTSGLQCDMVRRFETVFEREMGIKHCIGTPGCTAALNILAAALRLEPGDEIIVSPITDYGTVMGLLKENYIPVFPDTEPGTPLISARTIAPCITNRTRAILAVHITGLICDMDPIHALAKKHGLTVIEDVCQAVFGTYKGRLAGTLGDVAAFSFDTPFMSVAESLGDDGDFPTLEDDCGWSINQRWEWVAGLIGRRQSICSRFSVGVPERRDAIPRSALSALVGVRRCVLETGAVGLGDGVRHARRVTIGPGRKELFAGDLIALLDECDPLQRILGCRGVDDHILRREQGIRSGLNQSAEPVDGAQSTVMLAERLAEVVEVSEPEFSQTVVGHVL